MSEKEIEEGHCFHARTISLGPEKVSWISLCCYCNRNTVPKITLDENHGGFSGLFVATVDPEVKAEECPMRYNTGASANEKRAEIEKREVAGEEG